MAHLTQQQRYHISALKQAGKKQKEIASELGVHPATICRELKRTGSSKKKPYNPEKAHKNYVKKKFQQRMPYKLNIIYKNIIRGYLEMYLSPEQIQHLLLRDHQLSISVEWIYFFIYEASRNGSNLYQYLRQARRQRKKRKNSKHYRFQIPNKVSIKQRPEEVTKKEKIGHWEADTIVGQEHQSYLLVVVERVSKFVIIYTLSNIEKETMKAAFLDIIQQYGRSIFLSFTCDNGIEFQCHEEVTQEVHIPFYFAHPYSPWERGLNENTNGLIRQFIPKSTDFNELKISYITSVQNNLNNRIRKTLNFKTPNQLLNL